MGDSETQTIQRDWRFWMIFLCITLSSFVTALELVNINYPSSLCTGTNVLHSQPYLQPFLLLSMTSMAASSYGLAPVRYPSM